MAHVSNIFGDRNGRDSLGIAQGHTAHLTSGNKFGRSTNVDNGVATDIWDRANPTDDQATWVAPTQARIHNIASTSASDDGSPAGVGAQTVRIYGLVDWTTPEVSEDIILNGVTDVPTVNAYVIIHRILVLTWGTSGPNVGVITATAVTDGTVTAQVNVGEGQTQMAIYGLPSGQTIYLVQYYGELQKSGGATGGADIRLKVNSIPNTQIIGFTTKHILGLLSTGNSYVPHYFKPELPVSGPAIIKVEATGGVNNLDVSGGFDFIIAED